jgi:c(7)-type cytochrome triheme protein
MPTCDGCHARGAAAAAAARPADPFAVTGAFDHGRHARAERVGAAGEACLTCHDNLATSTDDRALPMPAMRGCYQRCHDGRRAFSATADTCTRCHKGGRK